MTDAAIDRAQPRPRTDFAVFRSISTRWADNDAYGHVNNVVYYAWFDTVVNAHLVESGLLDIERSPSIGLVVETRCHYFAPLAFPQTVELGLQVARLGQTSVRYEIGVFAEGALYSAAHGHLVHVYVDRSTRQPTPLPTALRARLQSLVNPRSPAP